MELPEKVLAGLAEMPAEDLVRLREGSYQTPDGKTVQFTDAETLRDARDLYAVLKEEHGTGSSNLENDQCREIVTDLQAGKPLDNAQFGALQTLLAKYRGAIAKLRASPDHQGQDYGRTAPEGKGRLSP